MTRDEVPDPSALDIIFRLNGRELQRDNTRGLVFNVQRTIAECSTIIDLVPGDIIAMGTPGGVGWTRKPPIWLKPGDIAEVEIPGVGLLQNPVMQET